MSLSNMPPRLVLLRRLLRLPLQPRLTAHLAARATSSSSSSNSGRNFYISEGSNDTNISEEVRDLIRHQRTADNVDEWKLGYGIQEPIVLSMKEPQDIDDDQTPDMVYHPHKGEKLPPEGCETTSPVFLVKRVKTLKTQPYWHVETCERLGLGKYAPPDKIAVVPNMPSMNYKLFSVKHLIEIIPVKFPMGLPEDEDFDPAACRINQRGEFYFHPKLKVDRETMEAKAPMKISEKEVWRDAERHWNKPWNTPLGNSNYFRDSRYSKPEMRSRATDPGVVIKYSD